MSLARIAIENFRNIRRANIVLSPRLTLLVGDNAQGKTNGLEAISLLLSGTPLRGQSEREMVAWGEGYYRLTGDWVDRDHITPRERSVGLNPVRRRVASPMIPTVSFSPDDTLLIKGSPELRRRFLDQLAAQIHPRYRRELHTYQRALSQRNRALKDQESATVIQSFEPILAASGSYLWHQRQALLDRFRPIMVSTIGTLAPQEAADLRLVPGTHGHELEAESLVAQYRLRLNEERARGITLTGPHRDDLLVEVNGRPAGQYASQGQQRTLALALRLASRVVLEQELDQRPVVLLDDVLSELDEGRRHHLLALMSADHQQTIVTDTETRSFGALNPKVIRVTAGSFLDQEDE